MSISPQTEVRLLNVPFSSNYSDVMDFGSVSEQTSYFKGKTLSNGNLDEFLYVRQNNSIKVPLEMDKVLTCNYVMYKNDNYSNKWFYGFVNDMRYVNPNTTELFISTDVWQTWLFDVDIQPSFIERSHVDRWNGDGSPVVNTLDEGLAYGDEYDVVSITQYVPLGDISFLVIGAKNRLHNVSQVTVTQNGIPQPLSFYIHPFRRSNGGTPPTNIGGSAVTIGTLASVLEAIYSDPKAVNNIVSLCITDYLGLGASFDGTTLTFTGNELQQQTIGTSSINTLYFYNANSYTTLINDLGDKYSGYKSVKESKLLMFPYTSVVLSDSKGQQIQVRNEYIKNSNLAVRVRGSIGTSNKVAYAIDDYLMDSNSSNSKINEMAYSVISNEANDVPIITDLLSAYLQGNKNMIASQKSQINFNMKMDDYQGIGSMVANAPSNLATLPFGGANNIVQEGLGNLQRRGNQQIALQNIMNKQKDISNVPPSVSGLGSNAYFDYGNGINGVYVIKKQIKQEYIDRLEDFFGMFGYKINRVQQPNFKSREHFNYIKTQGITIQGSLPQNDLNTIKSIFDNGVTVWHTEDIGNYSLTNSEV